MTRADVTLTSQGVPCGLDAVEVSVIYAPLSGSKEVLNRIH